MQTGQAERSVQGTDVQEGAREPACLRAPAGKGQTARALHSEHQEEFSLSTWSEANCSPTQELLKVYQATREPGLVLFCPCRPFPPPQA